MKKKIVATLLSMAMVVGLLVGCGGTAGDSSQSKGSSKNANGTVELDFCFPVEKLLLMYCRIR